MPIVTITVHKGRNEVELRALADTLHKALVEGGFPPNDRFQKIVELEEGRFIVDPTFPNLPVARGENYVEINLALNKRRFPDAMLQKTHERIIALLNERHGLGPQDSSISFTEVAHFYGDINPAYQPVSAEAAA